MTRPQPPKAVQDDVLELSKREREILDAILRDADLSLQEHAKKMGITYHTLRTHISNILIKRKKKSLRELILSELSKHVGAPVIASIAVVNDKVVVSQIEPMDFETAVWIVGRGGTAFVPIDAVPLMLEMFEELLGGRPQTEG